MNEGQTRFWKAAIVASSLSGIPSTVHALITRRDPFQTTVAAGRILLTDEAEPSKLIIAGLATHMALSLGWTVVLARLLSGRPTPIRGALLGSLIGLVDMTIADRLFPQIAALPRTPQMLDHIAFGVCVASVLARDPH